VPKILMQIDGPAPVITAATGGFNLAADSLHPLQHGQTIAVTAAGLLDSLGGLPALSNVFINIAGVEQPALSMTQTGNLVTIQAAIPQGITSGSVEVTLRVDTRVSAPFTIVIQ